MLGLRKAEPRYISIELQQILSDISNFRHRESPFNLPLNVFL